MANIFNPLKKKINGLIYNLTVVGALLLLLATLIVWTDFMARLVLGVIVLLVAYVFFYAAYKIWALKKDAEKYLKL
ncbi:hypothetical protein HY798_00025 [Candidatus Falkowbacteria bacterium]|nr:hypothetical protein [Candidatus Falkowbacteria bacterium]